MKQRGIKFTDEQWAIIQDLAKGEGITAGDFVRECVHQQFLRAKRRWPYAPKWGGKR